MSSTLDLINADIATLTTLVVPPATDAQLGWGVDLSCVSDCADSFAEIDPNSPIGIAEAAIRRLTTPRGAMQDDPDYGLYLSGYCNNGVSVQQLQDLNGMIVNELRKDDRIDDVGVTVAQSDDFKELSVTLTITPADPTQAQFTLVLSVTSGDVLLVTIT
jgi:hypothetical protein